MRSPLPVTPARTRQHRDGRLTAEIHALDGIDTDPLIRPDTTMEALAKLPPVFDRSDSGTLTAGNSSPLTDGAAATLLMAEDRAEALGYEPLAFVKDYINVGIEPADGLLMGPGVAVPRLLARNGLALDDLDLIEMHEAFAGQVAANLKAWEYGWKEPAIGAVDRDKLNVSGSSIAVGHPVCGHRRSHCDDAGAGNGPARCSLRPDQRVRRRCHGNRHAVGASLKTISTSGRVRHSVRLTSNLARCLSHDVLEGMPKCGLRAVADVLGNLCHGQVARG